MVWRSERGKGSSKSGFTLIELIMVIAVLAIISSLAVSRYGALQERSARRLSRTNQILITQAVETFIASNEEVLDKLDALIDYGTADVAAGPTFNGAFAGQYGDTLNETTSVGGIYRGPKGAAVSEEILRQNAGLAPALAKVLVVYYPTAAEVQALEQLGIKRLLRAWSDPASAPNDTNIKGDDGSYVALANGIDLAAASAIITSNRAGRALAAVNIAFGHSATGLAQQSDYKKGARIYQEMGADIVITTDANNYDDPEDAQALGTLLAFGLGANSTMLGNARGGLTATPTCEFLHRKYYRNYILLIRLKRPANQYGSVIAEFAGVLDPDGNTIENAKLQLGE